MRSLKHVVLVAFVVAGCGTGAGSARVADERLVRLPALSRKEILDKQRDLNIAEGNLTAMRVAQSEAGRFKEIVSGELEAARARYDADERSVALAKDAEDAALFADAQRALALGRRRLEASAAKMQYALKLKALRDAQVQEASAALDLARARFELAKYEELKMNDMASDLEPRPFVRAAELAAKRLGDRRERTASLRTDVDARQRTWQALRQRYDEAAERTGEIPLDAPAPPEPLRTPG